MSVKLCILLVDVIFLFLLTGVISVLDCNQFQGEELYFVARG